MSYQNEDLYADAKRAIDLLSAEKMHGGALSYLPAGGAECEAKVAEAVQLLQSACRAWAEENLFPF